MLCRVKTINICIENIKRISIPQRAHKFALTLDNCLSVKSVRQPGCRVRIKIPADSVSAVGFKRFKRVYRIALGFLTFSAVLVLDMPQKQYSFLNGALLNIRVEIASSE